MGKTNLRWNSSNEAQRQADEAFKRLKPKQRKKKPPKHRKPASFWIAKANAEYGPRRPLKFRGTYHEYLSSLQWQIVRNCLFLERGERCEICHSTSRLHVHHKHYRTLFREQSCDLQILCHGCHANLHEGDKGIVMDPLTREFVSMKF